MVLVEGSKVLKLWTSSFSSKRRVMDMVICRSRDEERRAKGIFGCLRDRKVIREDLATISS